MAADLGTAYIQIKPSMKGTAGEITKELGGVNAEAAGSKMGGGIASGITGKLSTAKMAIGNMLGNLAAQAVTAVGSALGETFMQAFNGYADYEQLVGGVETLFKDSADEVQAYAEQAYRTAGLSANQYMETVTSFSASLLSGLNGDTAEAARIADVAITDMADNANKMGTSMQSIQDAYQGFAKQNYTMLDNLKLGYGGTKTEMERLLADAEKISGIHYDVGNYADVVQAIHVIQEQMGIAGTTAEEAAGTVSGSIASMQAAWSNWLTGIGDPNADMQKLTDELLATIEAALSNIVPLVGRVITGLLTALPKMLADFFKELPNMLRPFLEELFGEEVGGKIADGLAKMVEVAGQILSGLGEIIMAVADALGKFLGPALEAIGEVLGWLWDNILGPLFEALKTVLVDYILPAIGEALGWLGEVIRTVAEAFMAAADWIIAHFQPVADFFIGVGAAIAEFFGGAAAAIEAAWSGLVTWFDTYIVQPIAALFQWLMDYVIQPIIDAWNWLTGAISEQAQQRQDINEYARDYGYQMNIYGQMVPMAEGGIVTGPTLALIGEGSEPETVMPLSKLDQYANSGGLEAKLEEIARRMENLSVYIDGSALVGATVRGMDRSLGRRAVLAERGVI